MRHAAVLVPVAGAKTARRTGALGHRGMFNLSLVEKLKERGSNFRPRLRWRRRRSREAFVLVEEAVTEKTGWTVARDRMAVGFFSFGKFLMYKDLDPDAWPAEAKPGDHPLIAAILRDGFRERGGAVPPGVSIDAVRPPGKVMEVMDADGSQAEALAEVAAGRSLVIQGPPGTGRARRSRT